MSRADWTGDWLSKYNARLAALRAPVDKSGRKSPTRSKRPVHKSEVSYETPILRFDRRPKERTRLPDPFQALCVAQGLPQPVREFLFHPVRKWRFDYAFLINRVAVEVEGGIWSSGRAKAAHAMPLAILRDIEKGNAAVLLGWRVLRCTPSTLHEAARDLKVLFAD